MPRREGAERPTMFPSPAGRGMKGEGVKMQILSLLCIVTTIVAMSTGVWAHARLLRSSPGAAGCLPFQPRLARFGLATEIARAGGQTGEGGHGGHGGEDDAAGGDVRTRAGRCGLGRGG